MASIASKVLDFDSEAVEFTFQGMEPLAVALKDFSPEVQLHLALHGLSQKLGDSYSSAKGIVADAKVSFDQCLAQLKAGDWRASRGEGDSKPRTTELAAAVARIKGIEIAEAAKLLEAMDDDQRKTLRSNDRVKAVITVLRAEKAQSKLDKMDDGDDLGI